MTKQLLAASLLLSIYSCSPSGSSSTTVTPVATDSSTFTLTFNGKTFHGAQGLTIDGSGAVTAYSPATGIQMAAQTFVTGTGTTCVISSSQTSNYLFSLQAVAIGRNTAIGPDTGFTATGAYTFTDATAGNIVYTVDSTSIVNITQSDAHWVAGSLNLNLTQGSNHYNASGNFKIYH